MRSPEIDERGPVAARQHQPAGELPAGVHSTFWTDAALREKGAFRTYSHWLRPGDLVFDVGANLGVYTRYFLSLSCRVVAVEPQRDVAESIPDEAVVVLAALGAQAGETSFLVCDGNHMMSTALPAYRDKALEWNGGFRYHETTVPVTTLDALIGRYGVPQFTKIDVEGFEAEILNGLTQPLPALSLEVQPWDPGKTGAVIARLAELGDYDYLYSEGETFELEPWTGTHRMYGDLYATLRPEPLR